MAPDECNAQCRQLSAMVLPSGGVTETELLEEIAQLSDADKASAPMFLPYLSGERTPHNDPHARGLFWALTHSSQRALMGYAVLEGVSFGIADGLRVLQESGTAIEQCSLVGGGEKSILGAVTGRYSRYASGDA